MTELQQRWIKSIEDYYRDSYPASMRKKVAEILPSRHETLQALYDVLIRSVSAQYRTVPDVMAIQSALAEVREAYPEIMSPPVPLLEQAPPSSDVGKWFRLWAEALESGTNPEQYGPLQEYLREKCGK